MLIILLGIVAARVIILQNTISTINEKIRPAEISLKIVEKPDCSECSDVSSTISIISESKVKIKENKTISFSSQEAQQLIQNYEIKRLPAIIIEGEINKTQELEALWNKLNGNIIDNVVIIESDAPYFDPQTNSIVGLVELVKIVDRECQKCFNIDNVVNQFRQIGVKFVNEKVLDYTDSEAQSLIKKFGIRRIPAVILSREVTEYRAIQSFWDQLNATLKDGFYALHTTIPPYRDLETNSIKGLVELILLTDNSCSACYNVSVHRLILNSMGISIAKENSFDISSEQGRNLISKYNITAVPTILLSSDAIEYSFFSSPSALQLFRRYNDGWFVFTNVDWMRSNGGYKDLTTGNIVK